MPVRGTSGFTLIEAVVATAILLLTSAGVTGAVSASLRGASVEAGQTGLERLVQAEVVRLEALPYMVPVGALGTEGYDPAAAPSLIQTVFPHALLTSNAATSWFTPGIPDKPATFSTVRRSEWGSLTVVGQFVRLRDGVWQPLTSQELEGWAVWLEAIPPSPAVRITVIAETGGPLAHRAEMTVVLCADRPQKATVAS